MQEEDETKIRAVIMNDDGRRQKKVGTCAKRSARKLQFTKTERGTRLMNWLINRMPVEMHLPGQNFIGPKTRIRQRLYADGSPKLWSMPVNRIDEAAYRHEICYAKPKDTAARNSICDKLMLASLDAIRNPTARERFECGIVIPIIVT